MRVIFHYQLARLTFFADTVDAFKKAFAKNTLRAYYTRCDATKGICEWIFFLLFWSHKLLKIFYIFFLLKKGTRIVQRAILERDSFLVFKEDIYSLRVHSMCVLIIMPHVNDTLAFVCLREEN